MQGEKDEAIRERVKRKRAALAACNFKSEEVKAKFATMPNTLEELSDRIDEQQMRADRIVINEGEVRKYRDTELQLREKKAELEKAEAELTEQRTQIEQIQAEWEGTLQDALKQVNTTFNHFFDYVAFPGEVCEFCRRE